MLEGGMLIWRFVNGMCIGERWGVGGEGGGWISGWGIYAQEAGKRGGVKSRCIEVPAVFQLV